MHFDSNKAESLPENIFKYLINLKTLHLNDNFIRVIGKDAFTNTKLGKIDLSNNRIAAISNSSFSGLSLHHLNLRGNPCFDGSNVIFEFSNDKIEGCIQGYEKIKDEQSKNENKSNETRELENEKFYHKLSKKWLIFYLAIFIELLVLVSKMIFLTMM